MPKIVFCQVCKREYVTEDGYITFHVCNTARTPDSIPGEVVDEPFELEPPC